MVEESPDVLELARYLHLNPLCAGLVPDLATLARYRWTVHAVLLGRRPDLQGGGLVERRGLEAYRAHDRILGQPAFVEQVRAEVEAVGAAQARYRRVTLARVVERVGKAVAACAFRVEVPPEYQRRIGLTPHARLRYFLEGCVVHLRSPWWMINTTG